jgi:hypothetical protein
MKRRWLSTLRSAVFCGMVVGTVILGAPHGRSADDTHKQAWAIKPTVNGEAVTLNTYCADKAGDLWMCCQDAQGIGYLVVSNPQGEIQKAIALSFVPQAINFSQTGEMFVAGSGKVARLNATGELLAEVPAPNLQDTESAMESMKARVQEMVDQMVEQSATQLKAIDDSIEQLTVAPADETDRAKKRRELRLEALKQQRATSAESIEQTREVYTQAYASMASLDRLKSATGIAVTRDDVFVSLPSAQGFGYAIWRLNHDLSEPKEVIPTASGCCGQLDIQSDGDNLVLAANTQFQVIRYDRDGNQIAAFGEKNRGSDAGFGSCCNPMNVRCCDNGEILTAESSIGHIKRFSADGEYLGRVGTAKIGGGCKHVAVSYDSSRNYYYMMNISKGNIAVLVPRDQVTEETADEKEARLANEGLGRKLMGAWKIQVAKPKESAESDSEEALGLEDDYYSEYLGSQFAYVHFHSDGGVVTAEPTSASGSAGGNASSNQQESESFLGALASVFWGEESEPVSVTATTDFQWRAIRQSDDSLDLVFIQEEVEHYGVRARFVDDKTIACDWFYGDPAEGSSLNYSTTYLRTSAPGCESGECSGDACACEKQCETEGEVK